MMARFKNAQSHYPFGLFKVEAVKRDGGTERGKRKFHLTEASPSDLPQSRHPSPPGNSSGHLPGVSTVPRSDGCLPRSLLHFGVPS